MTATSLPALHHRLVGREDALARVEGTLEHGARLVTITGPGGAGKSRLALEVAARAALDRPVHLVGLAPVSDAELVPSAIGRMLGIRESPSQPVIEAVAERLEGSGALLYLDNLEHLPGTAAHVAALLNRAPDLQVLATSRTPLRLSAEHVLPLEPLAVEDAATLFIELAAARGVVLQEDALSSVHEICRRLDGLPLAIELVAARLVVLPPAEIVRALEDGLALEMEGPVDLPERQRTLRAAIDWSYGRLTESQRRLHGTLAVFSDSALLDDARALAPSPASFFADLEAIVGWSLVRSEASDGSVRLSMLETVREHALDHLAGRGELETARGRHADLFLALALAAEPELAGADPAAWFRRLEVEYDNLAAALDGLLAACRVEDALRLLAALERFWHAHAHVSDARRWLELGLASGEGVAPRVRAAALRTAALQAAAQSDWERARSLLDEARALYRELDDEREVVLALCYLSFFARMSNDLDAAERLAEEAVAVAATLDDDRARAAALTVRGDAHSTRSQHDLAFARYEEAIELRAKLGDPLLVLDAVYNLGMAAFRAQRHDRAHSSFASSLEQARALGETPYVAAAQLMLALVELEAGEPDGAAKRSREALALYSDLEDDRSRARCLVVLAGGAAAEGSFEAAGKLLGAAELARGDHPIDELERSIVERVSTEVAASLGERELARLIADGRTGPGIVRQRAEA